MKPIRTLFLGTPDFAIPTLETLVRSDFFDVVCVGTQPDRASGRGKKMKASPVKEFALQKGLSVISPEKISRELGSLALYKADLVVVVAYGQILSSEFLDFYKHKVVNIHGSLLPKYRGAAPIQQALIQGDTKTGVSLQVVVPKLDAGPLLGERTYNIKPEETALELAVELSKLSGSFVENEILKFVQGTRTPIDQNDDQVSFAPKLLKQDSGLNFKEASALSLVNKVRGFQMGPSTVCKIGHFPEGQKCSVEKIKVHKAKVYLETEDLCGKVGDFFVRDGQLIILTHGGGGFAPLVVQPPSKPRMCIEDFVRGYISLG